ncbi:cytochrome P450 [Sphingomonas hankookensis]|uniref:cytochrome P450 n=1 Tax=Sphingomonas hankookensis TaxID=563996 RepID=UPI001F56D975|nr:cytochrome P450 [Sphingomonas hankookensis]
MRMFDDFTLPGFWQAPFAMFERSFASGDRLQSSPDGGLAILGYTALRRFGMHPAIDGTPMADVSDGPFATGHDILRHGLFTQVGEDHRRLRRAVLTGLNHAAVKHFVPDARSVVGRHFRAAKDGPVDLFGDLCLPIAAECWASFAGYGNAQAQRLSEDVEVFSRHLSFDPDPSQAVNADAAARSMLLRTAAAIDNQAGCPAARIVQAVGSCRGTPLVASLLFDAIDTAAAGLAGMLAVLLEEENDLSALADCSYRELAIEEALRLATPTPFTVRQAREPITIDDCPVPENALIWMWWSAGNRDPDAFPEPQCYRPGRQSRGLPFGIGPHGCVGHGWTKQLAHLMVDAAFCQTLQLRATADDWRWVIGGARRPQDLAVIMR